MTRKQLFQYSFLIFLFLAPTNLLAKTKLENKGALLDTIIEIVPQQSRIFYRGMQNPIKIIAKGISIKKLSITAIDARIVKRSDELYNVSPVKSGNITILVAVDGKVVHQKVFRAKLIPAPQAWVRGLQGAENATKSRLIAAGGITAGLKDFDFDIAYRIKSFDMSVAVSGFSKTARQLNGERFTKEQLDLLRKARSGTTIYFSNIIATDPAGSRRALATFKLKIR